MGCFRLQPTNHSAFGEGIRYIERNDGDTKNEQSIKPGYTSMIGRYKRGETLVMAAAV